MSFDFKTSQSRIVTAPKIEVSPYSQRTQSRLRSLAVCFAVVLVGEAFVAIDAQADIAIPNGGSRDGSLVAGGRDQYTLVAQTGDRIVLQLAKTSGGAGFTPLLQITAPDGSELARALDPIAARLNLQAPTNGTYAVSVSDANGSGSGDYRVHLAQIPGEFTTTEGDEGGPLTNGVSHLGSIEVGDLDLWTASASSGDHLSFQVSELTGGAGFIPLMEVFGPDGTRLGASSGALAARVDVQATVDGTYTVLISELTRTGTGTYQLQLAKAPGDFAVAAGDEGGVLPNGTDTEGTITLGDLDLWSVAAKSGDRLTIDITEVSGGAGFAPQIELFGPDGSYKVAQGALGAKVEQAVEASGTYTLLVSDANQTGAGTYRLHLVNSSIGSSTGDVLTNGGYSLGNITSAGESNTWYFVASVGDSIVVRAGETTTAAFIPWLLLYSPDGVLLSQSFAATAAEVVTRATNSGVFRVTVADGTSRRDQTGSYRISLAKTGAPLSITQGDEGGVLTNGAGYLGAISVGDIDAWTFTANQGDSVAVRVGETTANSGLIPWVRLYGPDGTLISSGFAAAAAEASARVTNSGTYLVVVGDGNNGLGGTGNYRISLAKTGAPVSISTGDEGGELANGATYLAAIDTGDLDAWTFVANAGETVVIRAGETTAGSSLLPWLRLYGPDGNLVNADFAASAAEVSTRATNSGTFTALMSDGNNGLGGTGNYRISLMRTGTQPAISANDEGGPLTNGATYLGMIDNGDIDAWTFSAAVGENIVVRMGEVAANSGLLPWLRLYGPNGALLGSGSGAAAAEVTTRATNNGLFTVIAADGNNGFGGTGNYRLSMAKTGSGLSISANDEGGPMANGTTYLGSIETGDIDAWSFTANAGDNILVRMGETTANSTLLPWLRLYGPEGSLLSADFSAAAAEVSTKATNTGTFMVVAGDGNNGLGGVGTYRLSLGKTGSPLEISNGDEGGSMLGSTQYVAMIDIGDIDVWTFTACAGEPISLNVIKQGTSNLRPWLRLYGRDGTLLKSASGATTAEIPEFVAPESGTYEIVVSDANNGFGGSGAYQLAVNGLSDKFRLCTPIVTSGKVRLTSIGGDIGALCILLSSPEASSPLVQWTALSTNRIDGFGVLNLTNQFEATEPRRFFTLQVP